LLSGSTRSFFRSRITAAALLVAGCTGLVAVGCSTTASSSGGSDSSPGSGLADDGNPPPTANPAFGAADAGAQKTTLYRGNPLCNVMVGECMPDDDSTRLTAGAVKCEVGTSTTSDAGDGGTPAVDDMGCRIHRESVDSFAPKCLAVDVDRAGTDGVACETGTDCAAGFDCVVGEKGVKQCRHYCCAGTCKAHESQSGGGTFCDVQDLVDVNQKAPVCMPLKHCQLLGTGECNTNETCAVVTENGDTGCVAVGDKQVGASCDADHCAAGLTCLGAPGSRECFKLCKVSSSDCTGAQVCTTSTVFKDPSFGVCQNP
jgi:hypothetical protein